MLDLCLLLNNGCLIWPLSEKIIMFDTTSVFLDSLKL